MGAILRPFPNILITGRGGKVKPAGIPGIDWTHPLAKGLVQYFFDTGTGIVIDLVTGRIMTNAAGIRPTKGVTAYGAVNNYSALQSQLSDPVAASNQNLSAPFSVASGIFQIGAGTGTGPGYFVLSDTSGNSCISVYQPTTTTLGIGFDNAGSANNFTFANNTFYVVVGSQTAAAAQTWWVNGVVQTAGVLTAFSGTAQHYSIGTDFYLSTASVSVNANVFFGAIWTGRALNQQDAALLYTDPYCLLIPAGEAELPSIFVGVTAFSMTAATGNYSVAQEQERLLAARLDLSQAGNYALTSETLQTFKGNKSSIYVGNYNLTGEQITETKTSQFKIQSTPYTLTNEQIHTLKGYVSKIQPAFYALTIEQEKVLKKSLLFPQEVPFAFTPESFVLIGAGSIQMLLSTGSYALAGETDKLLKTSHLNALTTPFALNFDGQLPADVLLHMDGTNGSTTFTDATGRHIAVVTLGTVTIDTSMSVFGGASAKFADNSQLAFQNNRADFQFGTGDYTIDGRWYFTDLTNFPIFIEWDSAAAIDNFTYWVTSTGAIQFFINDDPIGGNVLTTAAGVFTINAFHHVAFVRAGGVFYIFVDGVSAGSAADTNSYDLPSNDPYIGPIFGAAGSWVDEFRVINGVAAWTTNFMVPSQAYTELGEEKLLKASLDKAQSGMYALTDEAETLLKTSTLMPQATPYLLNSLGSVARSFNGSTDVITIGSGVSFANPISISVWVYSTAFAGYFYHGGYGLNFPFGNTTIQFNNPGIATILNFGPFNLNVWNNVVVTYDGTNVIGYINGTANPNVVTVSPGTDPLTLGLGFAGYIADFAIWNKVLSPTEVMNLANGARANTIGENANLINYLPMTGASPEPDESGSGFDGVLTGTTVGSGPFINGPIVGYENLLWDHADNTQSVPYNINQSPTDLARSFNGTTDYIDLGTHTWDPTTSATFSGRIYIVGLPSSSAALFTTNNPNPALFYINNAGKVGLYIFNNWGNASSDPLTGGPTLSSGQWYHVAWTVVSGGNLNFYLNGILNGSFAVGTGGGGSSFEDGWIGADVASVGSYLFNGYMADIAVWNTILTGTQISNLAAGRRANAIGANTNLIANLPITGASPEPDVSGFANRYGTLNGTSVVAGPPALDSFTPIEGYETLLKGSADFPQAGFYNFTSTLTFTSIAPIIMFLGTGSYVLTDEALTLLKTSKLSNQAVTYSLNDEQLRTLKGSRLRGTAGTYSLIGEQLTLKATRKANIQATFYNLAGEAITIIPPAGVFSMSLGTGIYSLTDNSLTLMKRSFLHPQFVPYNITEFNVVLPQNFFLFPNTALYSMTGENEALLKASREQIQVVTYNLTDEQLRLLRGSQLLNTTGSYTFTGEQLTMRAARLDHLTTGLYSLILPSFSLTIPGAFFMTITSGNYALATENETLLKTSQLVILPANYAFTVETETALRAAAAFPQAGLYALTPEQLRELKKSTIAAQAVTYSLILDSETIFRGRIIGVQTGQYTLTGQQLVDAITAVSMKLKTGSYLLTVEALPLISTAPVVIINFTATPLLLGRDSPTTLKAGETEPDLEGEIS